MLILLVTCMKKEEKVICFINFTVIIIISYKNVIKKYS